MTAKFSNSFKTFLAASVIQSLRQQPPAEYQSDLFYLVGNQVSNQGRIYAAVSNGKGSLVGPTHQSGISDAGGVKWIFISIAASQDEINSGLYLGIATPDAWIDEGTPPAPNSGSATETLALDELITLIKASATNTRLGIARNNWTSGGVYSQFDNAKDTDEYPTPFYVVTGARNIYKCIENNSGGRSTSVPSGTNVGTIRLADKYVWKFVGSFSASDDSEFGTTNYVPVSQKLSNDSSAQWVVQEAARPGSISAFAGVQSDGIAFATDPVCFLISSTGTEASASLDLTVGNQPQSFVLLSPGVNYSADTIVVGYAGSGAAGTGCIAHGVFTSGVLSSVTVDVAGSGYTGGVSALVVGDGDGATVTPIALGGTITGFTILSGGSGYSSAKIVVFPVAQSIAAAKAILAPKQGHGKNILTELGSDAILMSFKVTANLAPYMVDGEFRRLELVAGPKGVPANADLYMGPKHPDYNNSSSQLNKYNSNTGSLTFVNNIVAINHTSNQEETIKVVIKF